MGKTSSVAYAVVVTVEVNETWESAPTGAFREAGLTA
jgi:hypothetical protein